MLGCLFPVSILNGIVLIDKPNGITSFKVVSIVRKIFGTKKVGHAGTLDPLATGLLPVLINKATKIQELIQNANKEYIAEFKLGLNTDTQDITGNIVNKYEGKIVVSEREINNALLRFKGSIQQIPPIYSAISQNGVRLYILARKGIKVEREKRNININCLDLLDFDTQFNIGKILVNCSKGTYIRSLCEDIGNYLGFGATLISLRRTKTCNFDVKESVTLNSLENLKKVGKEYNVVLPLERVFDNYQSIFLEAKQEKMFKNGRDVKINLNEKFMYSFFKNETNFLRVFNGNNVFLGLGKYSSKNRNISPYKILV